MKFLSVKSPTLEVLVPSRIILNYIRVPDTTHVVSGVEKHGKVFQTRKLTLTDDDTTRAKYQENGGKELKFCVGKKLGRRRQIFSESYSEKTGNLLPGKVATFSTNVATGRGNLCSTS